MAGFGDRVRLLDAKDFVPTDTTTVGGFNVGDRVRLLDPKYSFVNQVGTVEHSEIRDKIRVSFAHGDTGYRYLDPDQIVLLEDCPEPLSLEELQGFILRKKDEEARQEAIFREVSRRNQDKGKGVLAIAIVVMVVGLMVAGAASS